MVPPHIPLVKVYASLNNLCIPLNNGKRCVYHYKIEYVYNTFKVRELAISAYFIR